MRTENIKVVRVNDTWENRLRRLKEIVRREEQIKAVRKLKYYSRKLQQTKCKIPRKLKFLDFPSVAINIHTNPPPRNISPLTINATRHKTAISSDTISSLFRLRTKDTENTDSFYYRQGSFHSFPYFLISISQNAKSRDELFIRYAI